GALFFLFDAFSAADKSTQSAQLARRSGAHGACHRARIRDPLARKRDRPYFMRPYFMRPYFMRPYFMARFPPPWRFGMPRKSMLTAVALHWPAALCRLERQA